MFTGIIEETGIITDIIKTSNRCAIKIRCRAILDTTKLGDSIAVNGVCLTVKSVDLDEFEADVMPETISRTSLKDASKGDRVNLERAMMCGGRFGGHIVSGHIDGTGYIKNKKSDGNAIRILISAKNNITKYIIEKGSVALDGISLTVTYVGEDEFEVSVIPHTLDNTNLHYKSIGSTINIECDIVGKYVERLLGNKERQKSNISMDFLVKNGYVGG